MGILGNRPMSKRLFQKFLIVIFILPLFYLSCSNDKQSPFSEWMREDGRPKVLCTIQMVGDIAKEIGKDRIQTIVLIGGELDPHTYELVKGDDEKIQRADLIFYNGLGLEHGACLSQYLKRDSKAVAVGEKVMQAHPEKTIVIQGTVDPHIWMDVSLWSSAVYPIAETLAKLDPEGAEYYRKNAEELRSKLLDTHEKIRTLLQKIEPSKRHLVTSHDAFNYFARAYLAEQGEDFQSRFAAPEGLAPEGQLSPLDIKKIIEYVRKYQVPAMFAESNVSKDSLKKIAHAAKQMGLQVQIAPDVLYGDAEGPVEEGEMGYVKMMEHNAQTIYRYLGDPS